MRKKAGAIALGGILILNLFFSGCSNLLYYGCGFFSDRKGLKYESDGQFRYYGGKKGYTIIGEEDNLPETVYVPSHYKGKEILSYNTTYTPPSTIGGGHERYYHLYLKDVKRVYFPYNCDASYFDWSVPVGSKSLTQQFYTSDGFGLWNFISRADDLYSLLWPEAGTGKFFVRQEIYDKCILAISEVKEGYDGKNFSFQVREPIISVQRKYFTDQGICYGNFQITIANTSYLFNYEGSPNDGYFFINDFQYGGKIEDTPYKPMREGYKFGGWYKEPECRNEWDFERDTLPEAEYDEDGNPEFTETRLYAGWLKK